MRTLAWDQLTAATRLLFISALTACTEAGAAGAEAGTCPNPTPPDLAIAPPACEAARGLTGKPLICQDFNGTSMPSIAELTDKGWNFNARTVNCWQIQGALSTKNLGGVIGECGLTLPEKNLNDADKEIFNSLTVSIVHRTQMATGMHRGDIFLDQDAPPRLIHSVEGEQKFQRSIRTNFTLIRDMLSSGKATLFLKATSDTDTTLRAGWQIESIAVLANP